MYGLSVPWFTYALSIVWDKHVTAQVSWECVSSCLTRPACHEQNVMLLVYVISGTALLIVSFVLDIIPQTKSANTALKFVYRLLPNYCFGEGIANIVLRESLNGEIKALWRMDVAGWPLLFMLIDMFVYGLVRMCSARQA
jgi:ATP-binding cassette subfamily A (ABC1) protein 3